MKFSQDFSSGPTYKGKHYSIQQLSNAMLSSSHRSPKSLDKINQLSQMIKNLLNIPNDYHIAFINGSCTAAMECLIWNLVGYNHLESLCWDCFAQDWAYDAQLLMEDCSFNCQTNIIDTILDPISQTNMMELDANFSSKQNSKTNDFDTNSNDIIFSWTSTTSGAQPNELSKYITNEQPITSLEKKLHTKGLRICDAAAAAFITYLPFNQLDAVAFSLQKGLGSEAGIGVIVLSPKAYQELYKPALRPIPKFLRLRKNNIENQHNNNSTNILKENAQPNELLFQGHVLNTISMLLVEDALTQLKIVESIGIENYYAKAQNNLKTALDYINNSKKLNTIIKPKWQSCASICLQPNWEKYDTNIDKWALIKNIAEKSQLQNIVGHPRFHPCWRFWIGPMIETTDIESGLYDLEKAI